MSAGSRLVALDEVLQHLAGEVGRVPPRQLSVALATRSADGVDDDGGGHGLLLRGHLTGRSSVAGSAPRIATWPWRLGSRTGKDQQVDGRIEEISATVAAVTRAAGTALDPSTILQRTLDALDPAVSVGAATLWLGEGDDLRLVAVVPQPAGRPVTADAVIIPLGGAERGLGHLAASPGPGRSFTDGERALLDIAASQIAGALERARLFQEVMELERLKSDFIARVSHELRTPITIIKGFLDTMLAHEDTLGAEQRHHMLERSHLASSRLSGSSRSCSS